MPAWSQTNGGPLTEEDIKRLGGFCFDHQAGRSGGDGKPYSGSSRSDANAVGIVLAVALIILVVGVALFCAISRT